MRDDSVDSTNNLICTIPKFFEGRNTEIIRTQNEMMIFFFCV